MIRCNIDLFYGDAIIKGVSRVFLIESKKTKTGTYYTYNNKSAIDPRIANSIDFRRLNEARYYIREETRTRSSINLVPYEVRDKLIEFFSSKGIDKNKYALIKNKDKYGSESWKIYFNKNCKENSKVLGGQMEKDDGGDVTKCIIREVKEETGFDLNPEKIKESASKKNYEYKLTDEEYEELIKCYIEKYNNADTEIQALYLETLKTSFGDELAPRYRPRKIIAGDFSYNRIFRTCKELASSSKSRRIKYLNYQEKYLKYKAKYLSLKKLINLEE